MKISHLLTMAAAIAVLSSPVLAADDAASAAAAPAATTTTATTTTKTTATKAMSHHAPKVKVSEFDKLDTDKDGAISKAEWPKTWPAKKFDAIDADHDGKISKAEWDAHHAKMQAAHPMRHSGHAHHTSTVGAVTNYSNAGSSSVPPANNEEHPNDNRKAGADGAGGWTAQ